MTTPGKHTIISFVKSSRIIKICFDFSYKGWLSTGCLREFYLLYLTLVKFWDFGPKLAFETTSKSEYLPERIQKKYMTWASFALNKVETKLLPRLNWLYWGTPPKLILFWWLLSLFVICFFPSFIALRLLSLPQHDLLYIRHKFYIVLSDGMRSWYALNFCQMVSSFVVSLSILANFTIIAILQLR